MIARRSHQENFSKHSEVAHIGPMAQDFHSAFGLGASDTGISTLDTSGVALAAIQALDERDASLAKENQRLKAQNPSLEQRVHRLEELVLRLATQNPGGEPLALN